MNELSNFDDRKNDSLASSDFCAAVPKDGFKILKKSLVVSFALLICLSVSYLLFSMNILRLRNDELTPAITGAASVAHFL